MGKFTQKTKKLLGITSELERKEVDRKQRKVFGIGQLGGRV